MSDVLTVAALGILITALLAVYLWRIRRKNAADFDGGWHHENERRITRIRSPYIIHERQDP